MTDDLPDDPPKPYNVHICRGSLYGFGIMIDGEIVAHVETPDRVGQVVSHLLKIPLGHPITIPPPPAPEEPRTEPPPYVELPKVTRDQAAERRETVSSLSQRMGFKRER